jgi:hypothetical protein
MASLLGTHVPIDCPCCPDQVDVPIKQTDVKGGAPDDYVVTIEVDLSAWRKHIEAAHTATRRAS